MLWTSSNDWSELYGPWRRDASIRGQRGGTRRMPSPVATAIELSDASATSWRRLAPRPTSAQPMAQRPRNVCRRRALSNPDIVAQFGAHRSMAPITGWAGVGLTAPVARALWPEKTREGRESEREPSERVLDDTLASERQRRHPPISGSLKSRDSWRGPPHADVSPRDAAAAQRRRNVSTASTQAPVVLWRLVHPAPRRTAGGHGQTRRLDVDSHTAALSVAIARVTKRGATRGHLVMTPSSRLPGRLSPRCEDVPGTRRS
jgi:hypothetical protein